MSIIDLLILLVIAAVCGSVGQSLAGVSRSGCLVSIVLGFIGAMLGTWLAHALGLPELLPVDGFPIIWSIIGSSLFVALLAFLRGPRGRFR